jgi:hypothetical protein
MFHLMMFHLTTIPPNNISPNSLPQALGGSQAPDQSPWLG